MKRAMVLAGLGALAMAGIIVYGFAAGSFFEEGGKLVRMPWGIVSLVDVYVGFLVFSGFILWREKSALAAGVWIFLLLTLGNLVSCVYVVLALRDAKGDWRRFFGTENAP